MNHIRHQTDDPENLIKQTVSQKKKKNLGGFNCQFLR